jgi:hypothetical protein
MWLETLMKQLSFIWHTMEIIFNSQYKLRNNKPIDLAMQGM